jgi:hypothetical protein
MSLLLSISQAKRDIEIAVKLVTAIDAAFQRAKFLLS